MRCNYCGQEVSEGAAFCQSCGMGVRPSSEPDSMNRQPVNLIYKHALDMMQDSSFTAVCILLTVATASAFLGGGLDIIKLLLTIFLWIIRSKAKQNVLDTANMRRVSGCVFAMEIIYWIGMGLSAFIAICFVMILPYASEYYYLFMEGFGAAFEFGTDFPYAEIATLTASAVIGVMAIAFAIIAVIMLLINLFAIRNIHKFAKSLYMSAEHGGYPPEKIHTAKNWIMVLGILQAVSAVSEILSSIWGAVATGCVAAAMIISAVLISEHFEKTYY